MIEGARYDAFDEGVLVISDHRKGFPRARLPIRKNRAIVPFKSILNDVVGATFVNSLLAWVDSENIIKYELFDILFLPYRKDIFLILHAYRGVHIPFSFVQGTDPDADFDALVFVHRY